MAIQTLPCIIASSIAYSAFLQSAYPLLIGLLLQSAGRPHISFMHRSSIFMFCSWTLWTDKEVVASATEAHRSKAWTLRDTPKPWMRSISECEGRTVWWWRYREKLLWDVACCDFGVLLSGRSWELLTVVRKMVNLLLPGPLTDNGAKSHPFSSWINNMKGGALRLPGIHNT